VVLPNTRSDNARIVCERFREIVAAHIFEYANAKFNVTVSIGIVQYIVSKSKSSKNLVEMADKALYQAKKTGKDRVIVYT